MFRTALFYLRNYVFAPDGGVRRWAGIGATRWPFKRAWKAKKRLEKKHRRPYVVDYYKGLYRVVPDWGAEVK